jgi:hypothetical protein
MGHGNGEHDASEWVARAPTEVDAMVRTAIRNEPTLPALRRALYREQLASTDELTAAVATLCQNNAYANEFGRTVLRSDGPES